MPKLKIKNILGTIESLLQHASTIVRNWTIKDQDGTFAFLTDIPDVSNLPVSVLQQAALDLKLDKTRATVSVTASRDLALTDKFKTLKVTTSGATVLTIQLQATTGWVAGDWMVIEKDNAAGNTITVTPVSGSVTLNSSSTGFTIPDYIRSLMYLVYEGSNVWTLNNGGPPIPSLANITVFFSSSGIASTNQSAAEQWFPGGGAAIYKFDATNYNFCRIGMRMIVIGASGSRAYPVYDTDLGTIATTIIGAGTTASGEAINYNTALSVNSGWRETSWIALPVGAKADVYFGIREIGGDGVADPAYTLGYIQFKA